MKKLLKILPVLAVFTVCAIAYAPLFAQEDWKMNTGIPEISLRENEQELANRLNGGYEQIYSTAFISLGGYPKIRFKHGEYGFMLPDNSHILASSQEGNGWGVTSIEVDAEFYRSDRPDKHFQARKKFLGLLRELQAKGWKRYYYPGGARMVDKIDIFQGGEYVYIDYEPSEQEWLNVFTQGLESLSYELYVDGVILSISLNADSNEYWQGYSIYKISMEFDALEYKFQDYSGVYKRDNDDRFIPAKWLPMVEEVLQSNDKYRMEKERELKRQGIKIDESYQDPLPKIYTDYLKNKGKKY